MNGEPPLPELPLLAPWYRLLEEDGRLLLEHGHRLLVLEGAAVRELLPRLLPLLDGTRTVADIVGAAGRPAEPAIVKALRLLDASGLLVEGPPADCGVELQETVDFLAAGTETPPRIAASRILDASVGIVGESLAAAEVARVLRRSGIVRLERRAWDDASAGDGLTVVAPDPGQLHRLAGWNERALAAGIPWLQLLPFDGRFTAVGPLYVPGETACHACYRLRRAASLDFGPLADTLEQVPSRAGGGPGLAVAAGAVAAVHVLGWLATGDPSLPGALFALESGGGLALTRHQVLRVPRCPACSTARSSAAPLPWFQPVLDECA